MRRLVHVTTVPDSLLFLEGQPRYMRERGFESIVVSSPGDRLAAFGEKEDVETFAVPMTRAITPGADAVALARLTGLFRRLRPDIVHAQTPKGGLLGTLAATAAGVPARIYHLRGLPLATASGVKRSVLTTVERVACATATTVLCQSASLRDDVVGRGIAPRARCVVVGRGSNGVDAGGRFDPARHAGVREAVRRELSIDAAAPVALVVSRLVRDKGVVELVRAWATVREAFPAARLVVAGKFEERDAVPPETRAALERDASVRMLGFRADVERLYAASDVFVLPTYREGFPNTPLEASAMALPVVATRVTGCVDAVVDGVTGTLVPARRAEPLAEAIHAYFADAALAAAHGRAGRARVVAEFSTERTWRGLAEVYDGLSDRARAA